MPSEQVLRQRAGEGKGSSSSAHKSLVCLKQEQCVTLMKWAAAPNLTPLFPYTAPFLERLHPVLSPVTPPPKGQRLIVLKRFFSRKPLSCQARWRANPERTRAGMLRANTAIPLPALDNSYFNFSGPGSHFVISGC